MKLDRILDRNSRAIHKVTILFCGAVDFSMFQAKIVALEFVRMGFSYVNMIAKHINVETFSQIFDPFNLNFFRWVLEKVRKSSKKLTNVIK